MARSATDTPHTGVPEIDGEHIMQVRLLLALEKALESGNRTTALELMSKLESFSEAHFLSEQTLMRLYGYADHEQHERLHGELLKELRHLSKRIASEETKALPAAAKEIRDWLILHMQSADRAFASFVRELANPSAVSE